MNGGLKIRIGAFVTFEGLVEYETVKRQVVVSVGVSGHTMSSTLMSCFLPTSIYADSLVTPTIASNSLRHTGQRYRQIYTACPFLSLTLAWKINVSLFASFHISVTTVCPGNTGPAKRTLIFRNGP